MREFIMLKSRSKGNTLMYSEEYIKYLSEIITNRFNADYSKLPSFLKAPKLVKTKEDLIENIFNIDAKFKEEDKYQWILKGDKR